MELRNYQKDEIEKVRNAFRRGRKRVLAVLPCGAGKTVLFAYMSSRNIQISPDNRVLFLVHRKELVDQTIATFTRFGLMDPRIQVCMVQTLANRLDKAEKPSLIVIDECHHTTASSYKKIINKFPDVPVIGLTATPCRLDGKGLGEIFDDMEVGVTAKWLVENGYLCHYDYYAPQIHLKDAKFVTQGGDYDTDDVSRKLDEAGIYGDVMKYFDPKKKTIIYAPSLELSRKMVDVINDRYPGIARHFDGDTPKKEREEIIGKFRSGEIMCLSNRDLIGEGFDVPDCECCMLLRPTKSVSLYIQQAMRCMRPNGAKKAVIYDFVGNCFRHGLPDDDREWNLTGKLKCRNESAEEGVTCRMCKHCFMVYPGNAKKCPYCGFDNGRSPHQIKEDERKELERITELRAKEKEATMRDRRREEAMCRSYGDFVRLARERGYDPGWAYMRAKLRGYV
jgi:superfamily II DNA or RNA helicase